MTAAPSLPTDDAARQPGPASTSASTATISIDPAANIPARPPTLPFKYYRQYCFHLAPTFNRFCPMRVRDILRLDQFDAFEGQNIFFHLNHPIKWVRIAGVVVNVADYYGRHVYTIDDGSGMAIECVAQDARPPKSASTPQAAPMSVAESAAELLEQRRRADALVAETLGRVIEARGDLCLYKSWNRGSLLQVQITKQKFLRGTQQEIAFWNKVNSFARDTLNKPWVVDKQTVRACRKAAHGYKASKQGTEAQQATSLEPGLEPASRRRKKKWQIKSDPDEPAKDKPEQEVAALDRQLAPPTPPPRRRPRKKWQIKPDEPDDDEPEPEPEPMQMYD